MNDKFKDLRFDCVMPSHLLLNRNVEPSAKLFYLFIRNLCNQNGYCFARNKYLAELTNSDIRSVQRWLKSLEDEFYIEVEFDDSVFNDERKIFIIDKFKNNLQCDKNVRGVRQKCRGGTTKMSYIKEDILKEDIRRRVREKKKTPHPSFSNSEKIRLTQKDQKDLLDELGEKVFLKTLNKLQKYSQINPKKFEKYENHAAVIRIWAMEDAEKEKQTDVREQENLSILKKIKEKFGNHPHLEFGKNYIAFTASPHSYSEHKTNSKEFRYAVTSNLEKMGLTMEWSAMGMF